MNFFNLESIVGLDFEAILMVIFVDLVLSGDNAIVIGMAAASLPLALRKKAIFLGIAIAVILRIILASLTFYLLQLTGIKFIGAILLIAVCYFMWRDLNSIDSQKNTSNDTKNTNAPKTNVTDDHDNTMPTFLSFPASPEFGRAMLKIIIADITMSLDNVLAVAGIAGENISILIFGLVLSIILMAVGANLVARLLERFYWLGYIGLAIIFYVAIEMGYHGGLEVWQLFNI